MSLTDLCIKYCPVILKVVNKFRTLLELEKENSALKLEINIIKERLEKCEERRSLLETRISLKKQQELLKETKLVEHLNDENAKNQGF